MDARRTVLTLVFVVSLFLLWEAWMRQGASQAPTTANQPDLSQSANKASASAGGVPSPSVALDKLAPPSGAAAAGQALGDSASKTGERVVLRNTDLALEIDTQGARLVGAVLLNQPSSNYEGGRVRLFDTRPGQEFEAQTGLVGQGAQGKAFPNHTQAFFAVPLKSGQDAQRTVVLASESGGVKLMKTISLDPSGFKVHVSHTVLNTGADPVNPSLYLQLMRSGNPPPGESQFYQTFTGPALYTDQKKFQKVGFSDIEKGRQDHVKQAPDGWIGLIQHYFVSAWILSNQAPREFFTRRLGNNLYSAGLIQALPEVSPGAQQTHEALLYVGPQVQRTLEGLAPGLELVVDYSWLTFIAKPIYWSLEQLHALVGNWGWAIVLLTIIIKALFYPLSAASYKSMAKMKAVAPRMTALKERYGDDKAKFNQAMMELYKNEKINPLGGCLPVLVQIPVFLALYWVLLASVEMRDAPWVLWITDLAAPDPYYILPVIMAATMFLQTKLNPAPPDPIQAKVMLFMPLVFSVFFFFFPAGLVLYWLVNNVVSIAQQWVIMKRVNGVT